MLALKALGLFTFFIIGEIAFRQGERERAEEARKNNVIVDYNEEVSKRKNVA